MKKNHSVKTNSAFTLVELMVVIVILGILATIVIAQVSGKSDKAKQTAARVQINAFMDALEFYKNDNHVYPDTEQGLTALVQRPTVGEEPKSWDPEGYLRSKTIPKDPWGDEYIYISPGEHGQFDITSYGRDGQEGGEGYDVDITSWNMGQEE